MANQKEQSGSQFLSGKGLDVVGQETAACSFCGSVIILNHNRQRRAKKGATTFFCNRSCQTKFKNKFNNPAKSSNAREKISLSAKARKAWQAETNPKFSHGELSGNKGKRSPEYESWVGMIARCHTPSHKRFKDYGGRGIKVCEQWRDSFENFLQDLGRKPKSNYGLERLNNDGNYEPNNVVWANAKQQNNNRRSNVFITFKGKTQTVATWAREYNLKYTTLCGRLKKGWPLEKCLSSKIYQYRQTKERKDG